MTGVPAVAAIPAVVAIVEDHPIVAESLAAALTDAGFQVRPAVAAVEHLTDTPAPDVVLCDLSLLGRSGGDAVAHLARRGWRVLAMSGVATRAAVLAAVASGARGFVDKDDPAARFVAAVEAVVTYGCVVSPRLAGYLLDDVACRPLRRGEIGPDEASLLRALAVGDRLEEIAEAERLPVVDLVRRLDVVLAAAGSRDRRYRPTDREREVLILVGCQSRTQDAAARAMDVSPSRITGLLTEIKRKYLALHPEAGDALKPSYAALLWARELRLCDGSLPGDDRG
jgi:DNA-binding NarL/FixJ family response regulator